MAKPRKRVIEVPAHDYEPTKDEMNDPVKVDIGDQTFEESVQQFMRTPVEVREVAAKDWRRRRKQARRAPVFALQGHKGKKGEQKPRRR